MPVNILEAAYQQAQSDPTVSLNPIQQERVEEIIRSAESLKAVIAALMTSLVKKIHHPEQDIRLHKVEMDGGYSGRGFDTRYITPFIRRKFSRLAMKETGWLTRSIEQNSPFTLDFTGKIRRAEVKQAFLLIIDDIETYPSLSSDYLHSLLVALIAQSQITTVSFVVTQDQGQITIDEIVALLRRHFFHNYQTAGASRLPVLALYAIYSQLMELPRYSGKRLCPLKSHTTSDTKSRSYGDVEVETVAGEFFEGVEVKHGIAIRPEFVLDAYAKFGEVSASRYYLLTTAEPNVTDAEAIKTAVMQIRQEHGCEVIVNGLMPTLKYYLRLLSDTSLFLQHYSETLQADFAASTDIKTVHLLRWQQLLQERTISKPKA